MASCSSLLSEEQLMCSICLDVFTHPVSTPCGHNFCKACITQYWDSNDLCQCPMCKKTFDRRPDLFVNTFISELAAPFRKSVPVGTNETCPAKPRVSCDICTGRKIKAFKSCLGCQTSYCETHLEPHLRVAGLKKHKLTDPVENLEDRMCERHERLLELFCRTDQTCVCQFCTEGDHKTHDTVPLEQECEERKTLMKKTDEEVQQMIQERLEKVQEIKLSVGTSKKDTQREISESLDVFTVLVSAIQRSQAELIQMMEEKQKATEEQAECFIQDLEREITELKRRSSELEKLSHCEDHLHLLQTFPSPDTPPHTKDWSRISVQCDLGVETVRRDVSQLEETLNKEMEKLPGIKLKRIRQQYAVNVTLDPDTAYCKLVLSEDGKRVHMDTWKDLPDNPERFDEYANVLGKQSFSSGRFYYEVQVEGKPAWDLGVVRESIKRKGRNAYDPGSGYWVMYLRYGTYKTTESYATLSLREKPQKVGVFVDYEEGQVCFYDVEAKYLISTFTGCDFTEKLYPYFSPCIAPYGGFTSSGVEDSVPLIITDVNL